MASNKKKRGRGGYVELYNFIDKDPAYDAFRTVFQESGMDYVDVHAKGGPTVATLKGWLEGGTRTSRFDTLMAATRAVGADIVFTTKAGKIIKINAAPRKK